MNVGSFAARCLPLVIVLAACGEEEVVQVPSGPTKARYQLSFASVPIAVAAETLQVSVFDATKDGTDCLTLVQKQKSRADLPAAPVLLGQTAVVPVCDILNDTQGKTGALPEITYGKRTFLAVLKRGGADLLAGCAAAEITSADTLVDIRVTQINETVSIPTTSCGTLGDKCKGTCN